MTSYEDQEMLQYSLQIQNNIGKIWAYFCIVSILNISIVSFTMTKTSIQNEVFVVLVCYKLYYKYTISN